MGRTMKALRAVGAGGGEGYFFILALFLLSCASWVGRKDMCRCLLKCSTHTPTAATFKKNKKYIKKL